MIETDRRFLLFRRLFRQSPTTPWSVFHIKITIMTVDTEIVYDLLLQNQYQTLFTFSIVWVAFMEEQFCSQLNGSENGTHGDGESVTPIDDDGKDIPQSGICFLNVAFKVFSIVI